MTLILLLTPSTEVLTTRRAGLSCRKRLASSARTRSITSRAAAEGKPYTKTGGNCVYGRRHELPEAFHTIGKHRLPEWVGTLLDREERLMAMADASKLVKWLNVSEGPMASGEAAFITGHLKRSKADRQTQA